MASRAGAQGCQPRAPAAARQHLSPQPVQTVTVVRSCTQAWSRSGRQTASIAPALAFLVAALSRALSRDSGQGFLGAGEATVTAKAHAPSARRIQRDTVGRVETFCCPGNICFHSVICFHVPAQAVAGCRLGKRVRAFPVGGGAWAVASERRCAWPCNSCDRGGCDDWGDGDGAGCQDR